MSTRLLAAALAALLGVLLLAGCGSRSSSSSQSAGPSASTDKPIAIRIGTLSTEDSLPLWVADKMGYFSTEGIPNVQIIPFQSAQERDVAFASGSIDAFMGDIVAAANFEGGGRKDTIATVMLGADPTQGRFGIAVPPKSTVTSLKQLAGVPIGTSTATIQEYVLDGLMTQAGVADNQIKTEEVNKVPVRYQLLMAGKLQAAALPEPFLTLAEQGGARVVGDDTKSATNLSQTVLIFGDDYLAKTGGKATETAVLKAWDVAANDIDKQPNNYRALLVEKAGLPKPLATTYKVQTYPQAAVPKQADVDAVLAWMTLKGYLKGDVTYGDLVGQ
jgi:NitT/TauT family transport system substrate-binding protein